MLAKRMEQTAPAPPPGSGGAGRGKAGKTITSVATGALVGALSSSIGRTIGREVVRGLFGLLGAKPGSGGGREPVVNVQSSRFSLLHVSLKYYLDVVLLSLPEQHPTPPGACRRA